MNNSFNIINGNLVKVTDTSGEEKLREIDGNIRKVLKTENNIEIMDNLVQQWQMTNRMYKEDLKKYKRMSKLFFGVSLVCIMFFINLVTESLVGAELIQYFLKRFSFLSLGTGIFPVLTLIYLKNLKEAKDNIEVNKDKIETATKRKEYEKQQLEVYKKQSPVKEKPYDTENFYPISQDHYLQQEISAYANYKKQLLKAYKEGILKDFLLENFNIKPTDYETINMYNSLLNKELCEEQGKSLVKKM